MYLEKDREHANRELNCYEYCQEKAQTLIDQGKFEDAIIYHRNMIHSIEALKTLHKEKLTYDQAVFILKQIESSNQHHELLKRAGMTE